MGIPAYPEDWATKFAEIDRRLNDLAASAQTRVPFTGGTLTGDLNVGGAINGAALVVNDIDALDQSNFENVGVNGTLTVGGTSLALFLNPPYGTATKGSNQSIPNTTYTGVTGCTYTASADGYYGLTGTSWWDNDPDGRREAAFRIQGGGALYVCDSRQSNANTPLMNSLAALIPMTNGQTVELAVWHSAGAALNVLTGSRLEAIWRRPL